MDVLFLLLEHNVDIIDVPMARILANDEENDDDEVVHHVPPPGVWGGSRPGKAPTNLERHRIRARVRPHRSAPEN
jgi:hypothetical protein